MSRGPETPEDEQVLDDGPPGESAPAAGAVPGDPGEPVSVEDLLTNLEKVTAERDEYLRLAQSKQAELENFRKRVMKQQADEVARATGRLVESLLPVLDAFDYAANHGEEGLAPLRDQLLVVLEKEGLSRLDSDGAEFDPTVHEAVAHEPAEGDEAGPVVNETMRAGYTWQGQLLRAAMVKVKG
ncbi:MAG TPA: nucleotide exchange factor GrpE [Acidimicrobiales bacterium]|nr:nucleotide exchange factor GrpE [Acidimicrobiales bacterium]